MKRILLLFLVFFALPVYAVNWWQIMEKDYVDLDSIKIYSDTYYTQDDKIYTFWTKNLNDKSNYFINLEKKYNEKIWYVLIMPLIDCKNKTIAIKASAIYDLNQQVIDSYDVPTYLINWNNIIPGSVGEYYYGICFK